MFHNRLFKVLSNVFLLLILSAGQIAATPIRNDKSIIKTGDVSVNISAASRDIVLVFDTSASMAYETDPNGDPIRSDPGDDPSVCNLNNTCQPMKAIKDAAMGFIDALDFTYDRVSIITLTSQTPAGSRYPFEVLPLTSNKADVLSAINGIKVFEPRECDGSDTEGACLNYIQGTFTGTICQIFELNPTSADPSSCTSSDIGDALALAGNAFTGPGYRLDADWIVIPLMGGPANATYPEPPNYPNGFCPSYTFYWDGPFCRDKRPSERHAESDPLVPYTNPYTGETTYISYYDADDYARDKADDLASIRLDGGVTIYTIGLGGQIENTSPYSVDPGEIPVGKALLTYVAECAGENSADDCVTPVAVPQINHGQYFFALNSLGLFDVFQQILDLISLPKVSSVVRTSAGPTSASSVNFTVTFSESVTGVDVTGPVFDDFILMTSSDINGASVTAVSGSEKTYTVTVNTGSGSGTIQLNVVDNNSILDATSNPLGGMGIGDGDFTMGEFYAVDKSAPMVAMTSSTSDPTSSSPITVTVTFSENVNDFISTDIVASNGTVSDFTGSDSNYTFSLVPSGNGLVTADIAEGMAADLAGNGNTIAMQFSRMYDGTAPAVLSSSLINPNPTNQVSIDFAVIFSEPVMNVDVSDFSLMTSGVSDTAVSGVSGSGNIYTVTVDTGSGNGTIRLNIVDDNSIVDAVSNPLGGAGVGDGDFVSGQIYTVIKSATFADVSLDYSVNSYIERLYNAGITGGCSLVPLMYCPENTVTRAQMAIFLLRGIHGSGYTPPAVGAGTGFADVPTDHPMAAWIKQLAAEGITVGCGNSNYCPDATVTRAQMAVFLLRSKYTSTYIPPSADGDFTDVPTDHPMAAWIEQLAAEGITSGCGGGTYCPDGNVTRAQMAVFLVRTFNLP